MIFQEIAPKFTYSQKSLFFKYNCNYLDQLLIPYKIHGSSTRGILFFNFACCEPLKRQKIPLNKFCVILAKMNHFETRLIILSQKVDSKVFRIVVHILDFFFEMSFDAPTFKTLVMITMMGSIDHFSGCKLNVYVIAHTKDKPCTTN